MTTPMVHYPHVAGPSAPALNSAFDISETVLTTLTAASQFAPLPFLQEASLAALAILRTIRGAKDNKESFKCLANDACELVSAIICVYNDMEKDGLQPSANLKSRVEDLISLLKSINHFAEKHVSKGTMYRLVRLSTETSKIQQYRARLRQALDIFGLQSSISIHENVVQILKELREQELQEEKKKDEDPPPSPQPSVHPFGNLFQGNISGNIKINTINGNQEFHSTNSYTTIVNSFNHRSSDSRNQPGNVYDDFC
ncbi:hypothetical protein GGX14DRAFT_453121 [Mycena pura]|uniref:Uncharacterized protein n=1 Tax=Mycena pura TaxID=153505 RepID=A0AAD6YBG9_9AGAR|nr:hypothetical protein GGX14DRAFT_453121 [Mycena pura]